MKTITIKTQADFDGLPTKFSEIKKIAIVGELQAVNRTPENSYISVYDSAQIGAVYGSAKIDYVHGSAKIGSVHESAQIGSVHDSAQIDYVYGSAKIGAVYDSAQIGAVHGSAKIDSVHGSAKIDSVHGSAKIGSVYGSAKIGYVYGSAKIDYVHGSAKIDYVYESAQIGSVYESAKIGYVYDSAKIGYVYDSAKIDYVYESAKIGYVHGTAVVSIIDGCSCVPLLFGFSVAFLYGKTKAKKAEKTATIVRVSWKKGADGWAQKAGAIPIKAKTILLFKKVSQGFKTQEGTSNETLWAVGTTVECKDWRPKDSECGPGKFHACSRPFFCDGFRNEPGDRYIAIEVSKKDLYAWPNAQYPHKIAFRKGRVLFECDRTGAKISAVEE